MMIGYAFRKPVEPLRDAGAERVYYDTSRLRDDRAAMFDMGLREGDVLLLYSIRNLGGGPIADRKFKAMLDERGVSVEFVKEPPKPRGRPRFYTDLTDEQLEKIEEMWLDPYLSEIDRLQKCSKIAGRELGRGFLHRRFPRTK